MESVGSLWETLCRDWWHVQWPRHWARSSKMLSVRISTLSPPGLDVESVAHVLQGLTDHDREATLMSVDGVGTFDLISRSAMLTGLRDAPGCDSALPFVLQFYGRPSKYIWEDEQGEVHECSTAKVVNKATH